MKKLLPLINLLFAMSVIAACDQPLEKLENLAEQGDAQAQVELGDLYNNGGEVPRNRVEAVKWYRLAAEQRDPIGQQRLGDMYEFGLGVLADDAEAFKWMKLAAEQGNEKAQVSLGGYYARGDGVKQDLTMSYVWWAIAAARETAGESALRLRNGAERKLSRGQLEVAKEIARRCLDSNYQECT